MHSSMDSNAKKEYTAYTIRQKGSTRGLSAILISAISFKLLVPVDDKNGKITFLPGIKTPDHPEWLQDEMEFQPSMSRLFFSNLHSFLNEDQDQSGGVSEVE